MGRTETQRKILEAGKREFLEKGFKDASLNRIVAEAGFTKGAFYGYYPDKTALFEDLVGETASELIARFKAAQDVYFDLVPEGKTKDSLALSTQHLHEFVAFMYDHFDEFKLILCRAEGTGYADFIEELVDLEVDRSEEYYSLLRKNGMLSGSMGMMESRCFFISGDTAMSLTSTVTGTASKDCVRCLPDTMTSSVAQTQNVF